MTGEEFSFPPYHSYPPYFTLQEVKETRDKQVSLWCELILNYCRQKRVFLLTTSEDNELFCNKEIKRRLSPEARTLFLDVLVARGNAMWLDGKRRCLILWLKLDEWAALIHNFARNYGLVNSVMTIDELSSGTDVKKTELEGAPRELLLRALKVLEGKGRVMMFRGTTAEEEGVKFLA